MAKEMVVKPCGIFCRSRRRRKKGIVGKLRRGIHSIYAALLGD